MIGNALERFSNAGCFKRAHESPERESGAPGKVRRNQGLELPFGWVLLSLQLVSGELSCEHREAEAPVGALPYGADPDSPRSGGLDDCRSAQLFIALERWAAFLHGQKEEL